MKLLHVIQALWCEPWLIRPEMHRKLCEIVDAHVSGGAHAQNGIALLFDGQGENAKDPEPNSAPAAGIAIIMINGVIGKRVSGLAKSSGVFDLNDLEKDLDAAIKSEDIKGILLHVDSPGGTHIGIPEAAESVVQAAVTKPIVAFTDKQMCSGAYYVSAGADAIYATPSAVVGSIGVYMALLDVSRHHEKEGLKTEVFKHGKFKAMGLPGTTLNKDQRDFLQARVEQTYQEFSGFIKRHREVPDDAMEGQWFSGQHVLDNMLVDAIGSREDAIAELQDMIKARGED